MYEDEKARIRARQSRDIARERKDLEELATIAQAELHVKVQLTRVTTDEEREQCEKELAELRAKAEELQSRHKDP